MVEENSKQQSGSMQRIEIWRNNYKSKKREISSIKYHLNIEML